MSHSPSRYKAVSFLVGALLVGGWLGVSGPPARSQAAPGSATPPPLPPASLRFAKAVEMSRVHLLALQEGGPAEHARAPLVRWYPLLAGTLEARDAGLAARLRVALREVAEAAEDGDTTGLRERARHAESLLEQARTALVPAAEREAAGFRALLLGELLRAAGEGYEEAVEELQEERPMAAAPPPPAAGLAEEEEEEDEEAEDEEEELFDYPAAWAALQRARRLWGELAPDLGATAPESAEMIAETLQKLEGALPSPTLPPAESLTRPDDVELWVDDILFALDAATGAPVLGPEDMAPVLAKVRAMVDEGRAAYREGKRTLALEYFAAAYHEYYLPWLDGPARTLAPEAAERVRLLLGRKLPEEVREGDPPERIDGLARALQPPLEEVRAALAP